MVAAATRNARVDRYLTAQSVHASPSPQPPGVVTCDVAGERSSTEQPASASAHSGVQRQRS